MKRSDAYFLWWLDHFPARLPRVFLKTPANILNRAFELKVECLLAYLLYFVMRWRFFKKVERILYCFPTSVLKLPTTDHMECRSRYFPEVIKCDYVKEYLCIFWSAKLNRFSLNSSLEVKWLQVTCVSFGYDGSQWTQVKWFAYASGVLNFSKLITRAGIVNRTHGHSIAG
jgi:hypothetical protein